ncbi:MAG: carbohydrate kinase [Actinomycetota bacterium]|nr:carbohydrate kinase [Actinomycetota bacterium]
MILVCGEAIIDLTPAQCGSEDGFVARPGGSPLNVAVGLARLGSPCGFFGRISEDPFGRELHRHLERNRVDLTFLRNGSEPTALAFVVASEQGEADYVFRWDGTADRRLLAHDLPEALPDQVVALHLGSVGTTLEPMASTLEALTQRERGRRLVSFDPNVRPPLVPERTSYLERLERLVELADVVKVSDEDLAWISPDESADEVARRWQASGPALVVVTLGADGAFAIAAGGESEASSPRVEVVDTVGAGDAFTSGLLAWLADLGRLDRDSLDRLDTAELDQALAFAARVAALTCSRAGADPPRREDLDRR